MLPELAEPQFPLRVSDIRQDLAQFDNLFGLPAAHLRVVRSLAPSASPWLANGEEVLDTEIVHAVAPGASIVELLVSATSLNDPASAVAASVAALRLGTSLGGRNLDQRCGPGRRGALCHPCRGCRPARRVAGCCRPPRHRGRRLRGHRSGWRTVPGRQGLDRRHLRPGQGGQPAGF